MMDYRSFKGSKILICHYLLSQAFGTVCTHKLTNLYIISQFIPEKQIIKIARKLKALLRATVAYSLLS
jgi:hypothetical protein